MRRHFALVAVVALLAACQPPALSGPSDSAARATYALARNGDPVAQTVLGNLLEQGVYGPPDYAGAAQWYAEAVKQGDGLAAYDLAGLYERGRGVDQDYGAAARLYRKAADAKVASAAFRLGFLYEKGLGVTQDFAAARDWYDKAQAGWSAQGMSPPQPDYLTADANPVDAIASLQPIDVPQPAATSASAPSQPAAGTAQGGDDSQTAADVARGFQVHLASERSVDAALADWQKLRVRFPGLLDGLRPALATLNLGDGATYYQLLAGPIGDEASADILCARLQPEGQYCNPIVPKG